MADDITVLKLQMEGLRVAIQASVIAIGDTHQAIRTLSLASLAQLKGDGDGAVERHRESLEHLREAAKYLDQTKEMLELVKHASDA